MQSRPCTNIGIYNQYYIMGQRNTITNCCCYHIKFGSILLHTWSEEFNFIDYIIDYHGGFKAVIHRQLFTKPLS